MNNEQKGKALNRVILLLMILLVISMAALAGISIYNHLTSTGVSSVMVEDNIITPDTGMILNENAFEMVGASADTEAEYEVTNTAKNLVLHKWKTTDNEPFHVKNMFPGDKITQRYCLNVSYENRVTVNFRTEVREGYEKLAEVLKCKAELQTTGEILYDGLMKDMPKSFSHELTHNGEKIELMNYVITVYLDTGVGNEYQNKELYADFYWWIEGDTHKNLITPPASSVISDVLQAAGVQTGDMANIALWAGAAGIALVVLCLIFVSRKKEAQNERKS